MHILHAAVAHQGKVRIRRSLRYPATQADRKLRWILERNETLKPFEARAAPVTLVELDVTRSLEIWRSTKRCERPERLVGTPSEGRELGLKLARWSSSTIVQYMSFSFDSICIVLQMRRSGVL